MNLRESMHAAAQDAPLEESTVRLDQIVARQRRASATRRAGITGIALAAALSASLTVPALLDGDGQTLDTPSAADPPSAGDPPSAAAPPPAAAPPLQLTAAEVVDLLQGRGPRGSAIGYIDLNPRRFPDGDPCVLAPGAIPGRDGAPAPEDTCTRVEQDGKSAWVRRWGHSPQHRPSIAADITVTQIFIPDVALLPPGRQDVVITLANAPILPPGTDLRHRPVKLGPPLEVPGSEIAKLIVTLDGDPN